MGWTMVHGMRAATPASAVAARPLLVIAALCLSSAAGVLATASGVDQGAIGRAWRESITAARSATSAVAPAPADAAPRGPRLDELIEWHRAAVAGLLAPAALDVCPARREPAR